MNTTVGFNDAELENEYYSETSVPMVVATKTDAETNESDETEKVVEVVEYRETYSSSKGYWRAAIKYLQTGNEDDARWALEKSLSLNSKNKIATELLYQLDVDAINALGGEYFEYKVQYGDSLSKLAKLYLDDSLKFYLLAKYNDISDPSRLVVGQVIHIPGIKNTLEIEPSTTSDKIASTNTENSGRYRVDEKLVSSDSVTLEEKKSNTISAQSPVVDLLKDVREMLAAGENLAVIELVENSDLDVKSNPEIMSVLVKAYYLEAKKLNSNQEYIESKLLLTRAIELEPDNTQVNMMLIDMNEIDQLDLVFKKSLKAFASNDLVKAYGLINQVLQAKPDHKQALAKREQIKKSLTSYYYKQALMAQRKHELDTAIEYWDEVLALDKNNDNAKLYRAKAVSLKVKLERFVSN